MLSLDQKIHAKMNRWWLQPLLGVIVFHLVGGGWVLFGSSSFTAAQNYLAGMLNFSQMSWLPDYLFSIFLTGGLVFAIDLAGRYPALAGSRRFKRLRPMLVVASLDVLIGLISLDLARGSDIRPFIYGRF